MPINWSVFWTVLVSFIGVSVLVGIVVLIAWSFDHANYWWIPGIVVFAVSLAMFFGFATWDGDQLGDRERVCESCNVTMDAEEDDHAQTD